MSRHLLTRRQVLWTLAASASSPGLASGASLAPMDRAALAARRASSAVLLGVARAGARTVAVGERGVVLLSDDDGNSWRQATVPVSTTLTVVRFASAEIGFAAGHAGIVLRTQDGGQTWVRKMDGVRLAELELARAQAQAQSDDTPQIKARLANAQRLVGDGADKPWLALHLVDGSQAWLLGAYGLLAKTNDGGETWQPCGHRLDNPKGLHLNAVAAQGRVMFIAGEGGQVWRSEDGGETFVRLDSPYPGSWFAAALLPTGRLVVAGLRGNAFVSDDRGATFIRCALPTPVTVNALLPLRDGRLIALTQAGDLALSTDQGASFNPLTVAPGAPLTDLVEADGRGLVGTSFRGPRTVPLASAAIAR